MVPETLSLTSPVAGSEPDKLPFRFHRTMAFASVCVLAFCYAGCRLTSIDTSIGRRLMQFVAWSLILAPVPAYWHEKKRDSLRNAAFHIPWFILLIVMAPLPFLLAARLHTPLRDVQLGRMDDLIGIHVAAITAWSSTHAFGHLLNASYNLLPPLMLTAILVPAFLGKALTSQRFLMANITAIAVGTVLFTMLPAIGPWNNYHFAPTAAQISCQQGLLHLRRAGVYLSTDAAGVVCFPSFHVIWSILCGWALWEFRWIRVPLATLCSMIVVSTLTTGWHYVTDVFGGIVVAGLSIAVAYRFNREQSADLLPLQP